MKTTSGLSLTPELFAAAPRHIPCPDTGKVYKTELILVQSDEPIPWEEVTQLVGNLVGFINVKHLVPDDEGGITAIKINWWHGPDPRSDEHNHPWGFKSLILAGGYTEIRCHKKGGRIRLVHSKGDINDVPADCFHTVDSVQPDTVTLMVCGPFDKETKEWGHKIKGEYVKADTPLEFMQYLREANPFMQAPK